MALENFTIFFIFCQGAPRFQDLTLISLDLETSMGFFYKTWKKVKSQYFMRFNLGVNEITFTQLDLKIELKSVFCKWDSGNEQVE